MNQPNSQKLKLPLLIVVIILVLGGGGFAIWMVTKKEDEQTTTQAPEGATALGRTDASSFYSEEDLQHSALVNTDLPDNKPDYEAVLMDSSEGKKLIEDRMAKIQLNKKDSDFVRAKHQVGRTLVGNKAFSSKANGAIAKMFGLIEGTTAGQYLTYPVYGRFETEGAPLRADIENFLSKDGYGYNLSQKRHSGNAWWFGSINLNLMYGSTSSYLHSADKIWWGQGSKSGLSFFKTVNSHDRKDKELLKMKGVRGVYNAWGIYSLVKIWLAEMDRFDQVTKQEAITALEREGLIKRI